MFFLLQPASFRVFNKRSMVYLCIHEDAFKKLFLQLFPSILFQRTYKCHPEKFITSLLAYYFRLYRYISYTYSQVEYVCAQKCDRFLHNGSEHLLRNFSSNFTRLLNNTLIFLLESLGIFVISHKMESSKTEIKTWKFSLAKKGINTVEWCTYGMHRSFVCKYLAGIFEFLLRFETRISPVSRINTYPSKYL